MIDRKQAAKDLRRKLQDSQSVSSIMFVLEAQSEHSRLDDVTIAEHPELFVQWDESMALAALKSGLIVQDEGILYRLLHTLADATQNGKPGNTPTVWARIGNPAEEWPQWVPWDGSADLYQIGDKVTHNDHHWVSTAANNVWEPGNYGWEEAI